MSFNVFLNPPKIGGIILRFSIATLQVYFILARSSHVKNCGDMGHNDVDMWQHDVDDLDTDWIVWLKFWMDYLLWLTRVE